MLTIWKFEIEVTDKQEVEMPRGAELLFVGRQGSQPADKLMLWAEVDTTEPRVLRQLRIAGTGHPLDEYEKYVGSVIVEPFVWHLYDRGEVR